jgi:hydrogenase nickel incorporation protein HypB
MVLTKTDLLPYVPFDVATAVENARRIHPDMEVVKVSCLTGDGLPDWFSWLERRRQTFLAELPQPVA